jgi:hypothetical protein
LHFTPTSGSWLNLVEVFFSIITRQAIRRGTFVSVKELVGAIRRFIDGWNERCHPFTWTKAPTRSSAARCCVRGLKTQNTRVADRGDGIAAARPTFDQRRPDSTVGFMSDSTIVVAGARLTPGLLRLRARARRPGLDQQRITRGLPAKSGGYWRSVTTITRATSHATLKSSEQ